MSAACPASIAEVARARRVVAATRSGVGSPSRTWKARLWNASPEMMASSVPKAAQTVALCRLSTSPSMMSSWMSEKLCTSSTATAPGMATSPEAATDSADSTARAGRRPLPAPTIDGEPSASAQPRW